MRHTLGARAHIYKSSGGRSTDESINNGDTRQSETQEICEHVIDGIAYTVVRHFAQNGDLSDMLAETVYIRARGEITQ